MGHVGFICRKCQDGRLDAVKDGFLELIGFGELQIGRAHAPLCKAGGNDAYAEECLVRKVRGASSIDGVGAVGQRRDMTLILLPELLVPGEKSITAAYALQQLGTNKFSSRQPPTILKTPILSSSTPTQSVDTMGKGNRVYSVDAAQEFMKRDGYGPPAPRFANGSQSQAPSANQSS
ncbi:uncharacterized protein MEPE_03314 [Melanopsichium pennsylvanicum]|uniref:Uncharacterized protein n=1 Tax=Melanopsichium pennsylvanicum TaxID=63383 RepID=A0AAJ4XL64_9BASI|nr:uncharacterized protein MEPE_03314 [Melanopsichium pennsylvanicum]